MTAQAVLDFWFKEIDAKQWWTKSAEFDQLIESRFGSLHTAAARCELYAWRETPPGRLAEIIVLDQFSRNMYRNQPQAFACDALALALAQTAVATQADRHLEMRQRAFIYMPYMHSESPLIHSEAQALFSQAGLENSLASEHQHKTIIDRFGRYPHRNAILGRASTAQEIEFLAGPGSSF
jgi:uncharacterized protein (DUF924 family)